MWPHNINWGWIIAGIAVVLSALSFWLTRRRELAWKRTEFIFSESRYLDNDPDLAVAIHILEGRNSEIDPVDIFQKPSRLEESVRLAYLQKFDKLFNFFWRICYAHLTTKTFSKKEIEGFSWYLYRISLYPSMLKYCKEYGYEEINDTIEKLRPDWKDRAKILPPISCSVAQTRARDIV